MYDGTANGSAAKSTQSRPPGSWKRAKNTPTAVPITKQVTVTATVNTIVLVVSCKTRPRKIDSTKAPTPASKALTNRYPRGITATAAEIAAKTSNGNGGRTRLLVGLSNVAVVMALAFGRWLNQSVLLQQLLGLGETAEIG